MLAESPWASRVRRNAFYLADFAVTYSAVEDEWSIVVMLVMTSFVNRGQ